MNPILKPGHVYAIEPRNSHCRWAMSKPMLPDIFFEIIYLFSLAHSCNKWSYNFFAKRTFLQAQNEIGLEKTDCFFDSWAEISIPFFGHKDGHFLVLESQSLFKDLDESTVSRYKTCWNRSVELSLSLLDEPEREEWLDVMMKTDFNLVKILFTASEKTYLVWTIDILLNKRMQVKELVR